MKKKLKKLVISFVIAMCLFTVHNVSAASGLKVPQSTITKIDAGKQNRITLTWKKVTGADYYQIYRSTAFNGKYQKIKTVGSRTTKYTNQVGNGKTYYYKVRAVRKYRKGYVYGKFSAAKKATEVGSIWYQKVLKSSKAAYRVRYQSDAKVKYRTVKRSEFRYYKVTDLNKDGIKELLLSTCQPSNKIQGNKILLLTYWGNKVKPLICFEKSWCRGFTYLRGHSIVLINSGSDFYYRADFTVKSGKLSKTFELRYEKYDQNGNRVFNHWLNGRKVSSSEWNRLVDRYSLTGQKEVTYRRVA